jgi:hypothetical protein
MIHSRNIFRAGPWAALIALGLFGASTVFAERNDYKVAPGRDESYDIPADAKPAAAAITKRKIRERRNEVKDGLRDGEFNRDAFDKWYLGYEFPTLTLYTPEALQDLYEGRKRLIKEDLERATNDAVRAHLVDIAYKFFTEVASEDYHPAVRYNAMLIVGELNKEEANRSGSDQTAPVPATGALGFMIKEYKNPDQIDAVRLAALLGINRHVQLEIQSDRTLIPQAELQEIRTLALDLVKTREAPAGRRQDGHDWMRRRGLEILSWLAAGKLDQEIVDEIIARLSDSDENRGVRAEAALALNIVEYLPNNKKPRLGTTAVQIKPKEVAGSLLQFVQDVITADVDHIDKYIKSMEEANEIYTSTGGGGGGGSGSRMMSSGSSMGKGGSSMGPAPGGSSKGPRPGGSSMGPAPGPGGGGSSRSSMGPAPGGSSKSGGSSMGPAPGSSSRGGSSMKGGCSGYGNFGGLGGGQVDPYAYRIDPVYRKLRHEIACAMMGLRGTEEWRSSTPTGGLYRLTLTPDEKTFLDDAAKALKDVGAKFKVKSEELDTKKFVVKELGLDKMTDLISKIAVKAKPKAAGPELKNPFSEPDPAIDLPEPAKPAKTTAVEAGGKSDK